MKRVSIRPKHSFPVTVACCSLMACIVPIWSATTEAQVDYREASGVVQKLNLSMWAPDDATALRGAIVHSHGWMDPASSTARAEFQYRSEWRRMAREQGMALIGLRWTGGEPNGDTTPGYDPFDTPRAVKDGIDQLASNSGHSELRQAPLAFIGFSDGGGFSLRAAKYMETRCFAAVHLKGGRSIEYIANSPLTNRVPILACFGTLNTTTIPKIRDAFRKHRSNYGEPWMMIPDRDRDHVEEGDGISFGMLFIDSMATRLVQGGGTTLGTPPTLRALSATGSYLGSNSDGGTWDTLFQDTMPSFTPTSSYGTDPGMSWLPGQDLTMPWQSLAANNRWGKMDLYFDTAVVGTSKTITMTKGTEAASEIDWYIGTTKVADGSGNMNTYTFTPAQAGVYPIHVRSTVSGISRSAGLTVLIVEGAPGSQPNWKSRDSTPSDTTAPVNAGGWPKADTATTSGFTVRARINEAGRAYYLVVADDATAPTASQVKAGSSYGSTTVLRSGNVDLTANTEGTAAVSGLSAGTAYDIYVVAQDAAGNLQTSPVKLDVTTLTSADTVPPTVASGWPMVDAATASGFTVRIKSNESGQGYYLVVAPGSAAPTASQVRAGGNYGSVSVLRSGSFPLTANAEATQAVTGLSAGTSYVIYVVASNAAGNMSPVSSLSMSTAPAPGGGTGRTTSGKKSGSCGVGSLVALMAGGFLMAGLRLRSSTRTRQASRR